VVGCLLQAAHANEVMLKNPPLRWHYVEIGDALAAEKKFDEARGAYEQALKIDDFVADRLLTDSSLTRNYPRSAVEAKLRDLPGR
jgi:tetratricopeptide (TPR) repeat protein